MLCSDNPRYQGGGCLFEPELITEGQAYLIESVMTFVLLSVSSVFSLTPFSHFVDSSPSGLVSIRDKLK
jgi:hypothetical protein